MTILREEKLVTDSLGFPLRVVMRRADLPDIVVGNHFVYEDAETGKVAQDAEHVITISPKAIACDMPEIISHEVYHLFYSIRHLITVDEEAEAEVFGQLVKRIHTFIQI